MFLDSHAHLDGPQFAADREATIQRAYDAGVRAMLAIGNGDGPDDIACAIPFAERYPWIYASVGVHPHEARLLTPAHLANMESLARHPRVIAIGEIGLDYHYDHSPRDVQRAVFARLIALARAVKKPIVVHTRVAAEDTLSLLASEGARDVGGVIHCFSEDRPFAERALDLGFDLSFSGILTFKSARAIHEVAAWAPLDRILVETDSPYLAPVPMRGKPCEPAFVTYTATRLAELRGLDMAALAEATTANAERRFGRSFPRGS